MFWKESKEVSMSNIYTLSGKVPLFKAVPFGIQHVLAMFVANLGPIFVVAGACGLSPAESTRLIQVAMIIAGIGSLIQLFPVWRIGSNSPSSWG